MSDGWYGPAIDNPAPVNGGSFVGPVTIGVLHTTESPRFVPNKDNYFGHQNYPHFTVANQDGYFKCWQHISIRKAARALANRAGGVQTNREGCIQIEVVGKAASPFTRDPVIVDGLKKLMRWIESQTEIPRSTGVKFWAGKYGIDVPNRMSNSQWVAYKGWCAHQHVPENSHYDAGAIDINLLLASVPVPDPTPTPTPTPKPEPVVMGKTYIVTDPREIPGKGKPQYLTDLLHKRWITSLEEYNDLIGEASADIKRIVLDSATLDSIPTVGQRPGV